MWKTCVKHVFSCVKHVSLYVKTRVKITCLLVFYRRHFHVYTRYFYTCLHVQRHVFFTCLRVQRHVFFTCFTRKISCWLSIDCFIFWILCFKPYVLLIIMIKMIHYPFYYVQLSPSLVFWCLKYTLIVFSLSMHKSAAR